MSFRISLFIFEVERLEESLRLYEISKDHHLVVNIMVL
jgi:hypothetical protein